MGTNGLIFKPKIIGAIQVVAVSMVSILRANLARAWTYLPTVIVIVSAKGRVVHPKATLERLVSLLIGYWTRVKETQIGQVIYDKVSD